MTLVHSLDEARASAQATSPGETVRLQSPFGAAGHQGIGWWQALLRLLAEEYPGRDIEGWLDCGDSPGLALAALRAGIRHVQVHGLDGAAAARLSDIAGKMGAQIRIS